VRRGNDAALVMAIRMNQDIERSALCQAGCAGGAGGAGAAAADCGDGLAAAFLLLISISILLLVRAAAMVLRPVDRLVEASRALGTSSLTIACIWRIRMS